MKKYATILIFIIAVANNAFSQESFIIGKAEQKGPIIQKSINVEQNKSDLFEDLNLSLPWARGGGIWGDYDNDNDLDLLLTGTSGDSTLLYNNENGQFTKTILQLESIFRDAALAWGDYDNDNDLDLFLSGKQDDMGISRIYRNDGQNNFVDIRAPLENLFSSSASWSDLDNDGDLDLILCGGKADNFKVSRIYWNLKNDDFSDSYIDIVGFAKGSILPYDLDNDLDVDIVINGKDKYGNRKTIICVNNGDGEFQILNDSIQNVGVGEINPLDINFDGLIDLLSNDNDETTERSLSIQDSPLSFSYSDIYPYYNHTSDIDICDFDNDGDVDVLLLRDDMVMENIDQGGSPVFTNAFFSERGLSSNSINWVDWDNDSIIEISIIGDSNSNSTIIENNSKKNTPPSIPANLHTTVEGDEVIFNWDKSVDNETSTICLTYNLRVGTTFNGSEIVTAMSDSTGYHKIVGNGNTYLNNSWRIKNLVPGKYYWAVQAIDQGYLPSQFSRVDSFTINTTFSKLNPEQAAQTINPSIFEPIDIDNDGDYDFITGSLSILQKNNEKLSYELINSTVTELQGLYNEDIALGDYNRDGYVDIAITGNLDINQGYCAIYKNNGNFTFSNIYADLIQARNGLVKWCDFNNDGALDLLIFGSEGYNTESLYMYSNDGDNNFTLELDYQFPDTEIITIEIIDLNNDGKKDILLAGNIIGDGTDIRTGILHIFESNTNDYQVISMSREFEIKYLDIGDFNNDNKMDFVILGFNNTEFYFNKMDSHFEKYNGELPFIKSGIACFMDYNLDNYIDLFITQGKFTGENNWLLLNNTNSDLEDEYITFDQNLSSGLEPNNFHFLDINGDKNPDIAHNGEFFINNHSFSESTIVTPSGLSENKKSSGIEFSWDLGDPFLSNDDAYYTYNVRLGKTPGGSEIVSPMSDLESGFLRYPNLGNANYNKYQIDSLADGEYYWSVQAISKNKIGGKWAPEKQFILSNLRANFSYDTVCFGNPTTFTDASISSDEEINSWRWEFGDGSTSLLQNPSHTYTTSGSFDVKLTVYSNNNSSDYTVRQVIVKPASIPNFSLTPVCHGDPISIINTTDKMGLNIESWRWEYGDDHSSNKEDPDPHFYAQPGSYLINLFVTNDNGCTVVQSHQAAVVDYPVATVYTNGPIEFCEEDGVVLSVEENENYQYQWKIDGIALKDSTHFHCTAIYDSEYSVEIENIIAGCTSTSSAVKVSVIEKPLTPVIHIDGFNPDLCPESNLIRLELISTSSKYDYQWNMNGTPIEDGDTSFLEDYFSAGQYSVVASVGNCKSSSEEVEIYYNFEVPDNPKIFAEGPNVWYLACSNDSADQYKWYYNNTIIEDANNYMIVAGQNLGKYKVSINNEGDCWATSDEITIPLGSTGIENLNPWQNLRIYPNPTPGLFTLEMDNPIMGDLIIDIFGETGRRVVNIKFQIKNSIISKPRST